METQFNLNRRTIIIVLAGLAGLLVVCIAGFLVFQFFIKPSSAPKSAVAAATVQPTKIVVTATAPASQGTPMAATEVPTQAPAPTNTSVPAPSPAPTSAPAASKPSGAVARGVYVTQVRVDPPRPWKGQPPTFYVTFVNTTGAEQQYRWMVQIYDGQTNKRFGQTSWQRMNIPVGTKEIAAVNNWSVRGKVNCLPFYAQAQWEDDNGGRVAFSSTNGNVFTLNFTVCP